jgi:hypothetical protein
MSHTQFNLKKSNKNLTQLLLRLAWLNLKDKHMTTVSVEIYSNPMQLSVGFVSSQLVRSLTKRPKLDLRQSIKGIRTRITPRRFRARGFFVHYLALTFSTLLSSQVSGAHRTGLVVLGLGQRPTLRGLASPSQTNFLLARTSWFIRGHQHPD